jgi:hypothetical protein
MAPRVTEHVSSAYDDDYPPLAPQPLPPQAVMAKLLLGAVKLHSVELDAHTQLWIGQVESVDQVT